MGARVWVRETPRGPEVKIEWADVIASVVEPVYAAALA
jgi:hypothetical protein